MEDIYITLLKSFEDVPVGTYKNISPFLLKSFPRPSLENSLIREDELKNLEYLLRNLRTNQHLTFEDMGQWVSYGKPHIWLEETTINAAKTAAGLNYLEQYKLNRSTINVNDSIVTNNKIISDNSKTQTKAIQHQTYLLIATAFFTATSLGIAIYNTHNDSLKEQQQQELTEQKKQNQLLQNQIDVLLAKSILTSGRSELKPKK